MDILPIICFAILVGVMAIYFKNFMIAAKSLKMNEQELASKLEAMDTMMKYLSNTLEREQERQNAKKDGKDESDDVAYLKAYV